MNADRQRIMVSCGRCLVMVNNVGNSGLAKKLINSGSAQKKVESENVENYEKNDILIAQTIYYAWSYNLIYQTWKMNYHIFYLI